MALFQAIFDNKLLKGSRYMDFPFLKEKKKSPTFWPKKKEKKWGMATFSRTPSPPKWGIIHFFYFFFYWRLPLYRNAFGEIFFIEKLFIQIFFIQKIMIQRDNLQQKNIQTPYIQNKNQNIYRTACKRTRLESWHCTRGAKWPLALSSR